MFEKQTSSALKIEAVCSYKTLILYASTIGLTTPKTTIDIFGAVRITDLTFLTVLLEY
jgi:hypothetical protein